jgi:hypothetical protein
MKKPKQKKAASIELASRKKKSANATSFKPGNAHAFKPGESGNVGGKPKQHKLLSRTLRTMLSDPAPSDVSQAFGLGRNASWSACICVRLIRSAVSGDLDAARLIGLLTEGQNPRSFDPLVFDQDSANVPPIFEVVFVDANGDGQPAAGITIDAAPRTQPAD